MKSTHHPSDRRRTRSTGGTVSLLANGTRSWRRGIRRISGATKARDPRRPAIADTPNQADEPMRLYDTARAGGRAVRARPGRHDVHVRHHAVRRHPPRPRRHLRHLRRAAAAPARPAATTPGACATSPTSTTTCCARPASSACTTSTSPPARRPASTATWHALNVLPVLERAPGHVGHPRHPRLHRHGARPGPRLPGRRRRVLRRVSVPERFGQVSATTRATRCSSSPRERGGNVDDPNKRDPLDFVLWQPSARRRAGVGVAVGPGPAGLAHRVLGAGAARARHHDRPARRRQPT